mgnify:CR=1 FL=1
MTDIISAFALVVSIVALWRSERERRLSALQASLYPRLSRTERGERLYVVNSGKAEARNVRVKLDGVPLNEHPVAVRGSDIPTLIGANSEVSCVLAITLDSPPPPYEIEIRWDDDSGMDRVYRGTLTF